MGQEGRRVSLIVHSWLLMLLWPQLTVLCVAGIQMLNLMGTCVSSLEDSSHSHEDMIICYPRPF